VEAAFVGDFDLHPLADGITWYLLQGFKYVSRSGMEISVPQYFETDFASVPRLLWFLFPPYGDYGPAACLHDWLYWSQGQMGVMTKAQADSIFLEAMETSGVVAWKRTVLYKAVAKFGQFAWDSDGKIAEQGISRVYTGDGALPGWNRDDV
jgi:hypothetical protein